MIKRRIALIIINIIVLVFALMSGTLFTKSDKCKTINETIRKEDNMKLGEVIKILQDLDDNDREVYFEMMPIVDSFEDMDGEGIEIIKHKFTIEFEADEIVREYKLINGVREYKEKGKEK